MSAADLTTPDGTAARVALWRAMHVLVDPPPHVVSDEIGLRLLAPEPGWHDRPDMDPDATRLFRAGVVARARFVEDLVAEYAALGVDQYVLLGAGLDTFAQRRPDLLSRLRVYEIDQPGTVAWKRRRLVELGYGVPDRLHLVPVDFEHDDWWRALVGAGFDPDRPAVVASGGVTMYLSHEVNTATLRRLATLPTGSTVAMTFLPPLEPTGGEDGPERRFAERGARASGTPFISFYTPAEILRLARDAGFPEARHVPADVLNQRYFAGRPDGLRTSSGEQFLLART